MASRQDDPPGCTDRRAEAPSPHLNLLAGHSKLLLEVLAPLHQRGVLALGDGRCAGSGSGGGGLSSLWAGVR